MICAIIGESIYFKTALFITVEEQSWGDGSILQNSINPNGKALL